MTALPIPRNSPSFLPDRDSAAGREETRATSGPGLYRQILGTRFFFGSAEEAVALGLRGGLIVFPSAPVLILLDQDAVTGEALVASDLAVPDSGLMVMLWNFLHRERLPRVSGLEYLRLFLAQPAVRQPGAILWVMPTAPAMASNLAWLRAEGHATTPEDCYLAPLYSAGPIEDAELLRLVQERRPAHIVLAIGGGVQERLGLYLRRNLTDLPGIHCIGAAIGFLSGEQAHIPAWADRYYLGWLARCWRNPARFVPRYWAARKLLALMLRFGASRPQLH